MVVNGRKCAPVHGKKELAGKLIEVEVIRDKPLLAPGVTKLQSLLGVISCDRSCNASVEAIRRRDEKSSSKLKF